MSAEHAVRTNSILDQHLELTVATGGTEDSCYHCTLPFSIVLLMIGIAVTAVAYSFNSHGSVISILGLVLLSSSLLLLLLLLAGGKQTHSAPAAVLWIINQLCTEL